MLDTQSPESLSALSAAEVLGRVRRGYAPPPRFKVSEFCDAELVVASGPDEGTRWRTDSFPYQRDILDAYHEPGVETIVFMSSAQVGKTSLALNFVAYHMTHDACPILVVEPTVYPMAEDFSKNRLDPLIRATPVLAERVDKKRSAGASNTTLLKTYRGGLLAIGGANSAASLAARAIRLLVLDEVDRYPRELKGEGATIAIARNRTKAYGRRKREFIASTPTLRDAPIDEFFQQGDQRRYHVPCPECGVMHPLEWANVKWTGGDPETALMHCPECDYGMNDAERVAALSDGTWIADKPDREDKSIVSFHIWEAYSPRARLTKLVRAFLRARKMQKAGDPAEMHTFINTTLGEPVDPIEGEGVDPNTLLVRAEEFPAPAPAGAVVITASIDTQDDRLELMALGWGIDEECWIIDHRVFWGDTEKPGPWDEAAKYLAHEFQHETGQRLPITASAIDTAGHRTNLAYDFVRKHSVRKVHAIIGRDGNRGLVTRPSKPERGAHGRKVPLYTIGVDAAKASLVSRLKLTIPGPGYIHLPAKPWADEEFCKQLTAERLARRHRKGRTYYRWEKIRTRNEALDLWVMGYWVFRLIDPDLELLHQRIHDPNAEPPPKPPDSAPRKGWVSRRPGGWVR